MPELPNVEYFKDFFRKKGKNKKIQDVHVKKSILLKTTPKRLRDKLKGEKITKLERYGKILFLKISKNGWLVLHFGMTGRLEFLVRDKMPEKAFLGFIYPEGILIYKSLRKFGYIAFTENKKEFLENKELGPDALDIEEKEFLKLIDKRSGIIKPLLLNQKFLAGIGNVYADEILFQTKMHPLKKVKELSRKEKKHLFAKMQYVLSSACKYIRSRKEFPKSWLIEHREESGKCPRCHRKLKRIRQLGRSSWFCPGCQKI